MFGARNPFTNPPRPAASGTKIARSVSALALVPLLLVGLATPARAAGEPPPIPAHLWAHVTGDPATADFVRTQIDAAIQRGLLPALPLGSAVTPTAILPAPQPLGRGFLTSFSVAVTIRPGRDGPPFAATTTVAVTNADLPGFTPVSLAFRDDPEKIVADGVLSRTVVHVGRPVRVYYYHQNVGVERRFCVLLSANDSVSTRVHLVGAAAGPNVDVMGVGHAVTKTFLEHQPADEGEIVAVAGGRPYLQRDTLVAPGEGIVGSLDLNVLDGGPLTVTVVALAADADPLAALYGPQLPPDGHARHGDFELAGFAQWVVAYTAGGPDATYVYGSRNRTPANLEPADAGHDFGDYGVLQRITFDLANPAPDPVTVYLYERPLGGVVRSSFLVDGKLSDVGCVRVAKRYAIATRQLGPHATAALDVLTMTDGGSNYPLELGVTTVPPLPAAPPIAAADGCFPKPPAARPVDATGFPAPGS